MSFLFPLSSAILSSKYVLACIPLCVCLLAAMITHQAKSHTPVDPDGKVVTWYPHECCHDHDCQPVASVRETPEGLWMTMVDGASLLISREEPRRSSRDMRWHICLGTAGHKDVVVQCLFEPPSM
jgi:hypothetical protein